MRPAKLTLLLPALQLFIGCHAVSPAMAPERGQPPGVAVWELEDLTGGGPLARAGELLAARISGTLTRKGKYAVVERSMMVRILEEQHLSASELAERGTRLRLGELMGARLMVFGGYQALGERMRIDIRLVDVETGEIRKAVKRIVLTPDLQALLHAAEAAAEEL